MIISNCSPYVLGFFLLRTPLHFDRGICSLEHRCQFQSIFDRRCHQELVNLHFLEFLSTGTLHKGNNSLRYSDRGSPYNNSYRLTTQTQTARCGQYHAGRRGVSFTGSLPSHPAWPSANGLDYSLPRTPCQISELAMG